MSLTDAAIRSTKAATKPVELRAGKGLFCVVGTSGHKSWVLRFRGQRWVIGSYPDLSLAKAREQAMATKIGVRTEAVKPKREAKSKPEPKKDVGLTVGQAWALYMDAYRARDLSRPDARDQMFFRDVAGPLGTIPILEVTDEQIQRVVNGKRDGLRAKGKTGRGSLNLYLMLSAFFGWCAKDGRLETGLRVRTNPMLDVTKPTEAGQRDRWLDDKELGWLIPAIRAAGDHAAPFELLLRSLCRRTEIMTLTKRMVVLGDPERGDHLMITNTKNGQDHAVPLTKQMKALIPDLTKLNDDDIIWRSTNDRHKGAALCATAMGKPKARLDVLVAENAAESGHNAPVAPWTLHDLRRTGASHMDRLGVGDEVIEMALNHQKAGLKKTYRRYQFYAEKREALIKWNDWLDTL